MVMVLLLIKKQKQHERHTPLKQDCAEAARASAKALLEKHATMQLRRDCELATMIVMVMVMVTVMVMLMVMVILLLLTRACGWPHPQTLPMAALCALFVCVWCADRIHSDTWG